EEAAMVFGTEAERRDQPVKCESQVLVFVNNKDGEPGGQHFAYPGVRFDQPQAEKHHVVEVDEPCCPQPPLILLDQVGALRIFALPRRGLSVEVGATVSVAPPPPFFRAL